MSRSWQEIQKLTLAVSEVMEKHLIHHHGAAGDFVLHVFLEGARFLEKRKDVAALESLSRAIGEVHRILDDELSQAARDWLTEKIVYGPHIEQIYSEYSSASTWDNKEIMDYLRLHGEPTNRALNEISFRASKLRKTIGEAVRDIEGAPHPESIGRYNVVAIQALAVARDLWEQCNGKAAPSKSLNPASAFGKFVADLFEVCKIEGNPRAAMRAYARLSSDSAHNSRK